MKESRYKWPGEYAMARVEALAFPLKGTGYPAFKEVRVPLDKLDACRDPLYGLIEAQLELIFKWGDNEYSSQRGSDASPSVCAGDVIHWYGCTWLVLGRGFVLLSSYQYDEYLKMSHGNRRKLYDKILADREVVDGLAGLYDEEDEKLLNELGQEERESPVADCKDGI